MSEEAVGSAAAAAYAYFAIARPYPSLLPHAAPAAYAYETSPVELSIPSIYISIYLSIYLGFRVYIYIYIYI